MVNRKQTPSVLDELLDGNTEKEKTKPVKATKAPARIKRTYEIDSTISREMKILSAIEGITINRLVENALIEYLKRHKR